VESKEQEVVVPIELPKERAIQVTSQENCMETA